MTQLIQTFAEIATRYEILFCDLWGCLHNGKAPFPAAVLALQGFRKNGGHVVLLTNAPRPSSLVVEQLDRLGVAADTYDIVVSSGDAAQAALFSGAVGRCVYHLGPEKDQGFFDQVPAELADAEPIIRVPLDEADGIACTGLFDDQTETPENYRGILLAAKARGLKLLCANPDMAVDLGDKRIYCGGALAALYEEMGGESLYYGKPHPPIYDLARRKVADLIGKEPDVERTLAIGDGIKTDILGGIGEGIDTLFVTGGLETAHFGPNAESPDVGMLNDWLVRLQLSPTYSIGNFR
jgi:HAD superfamily hydrolase (TIGR01459 family)